MDTAGGFKLQPRLAAVAGMIPPGTVVADLGTDHAFLPIYLALSERHPRIIATEARPGPLAAARENIRRFGVEGRVEVRAGEGLAPLAVGEAGVVVIAGMGGARVAGILERDPLRRAGVGLFVLQPLGASGALRRWLLGNGYRIADEDLVQERGLLYEVIAAEPARPVAHHHPAAGGSGDLLLEVGPVLWEKRHPLLPGLLRQRIESYREAVREMAKARHPLAGEKRARLLEKLSSLEELLANFPREGSGTCS